MISLAVTVDDEMYASDALVLSERLGLPLLPGAPAPRELTEPEALVCVGSGAVYLQQTGPRAPGPVAVEFGSAAMRHRRKGGQNELLGKAVGIGKKSELRVLDATAGLGRDSWVLADLGCLVTLAERHLLVQEMLRSGIEEAHSSEDPWLREVVSRLEMHLGDARTLPEERAGLFDVIYLDPMFPARSKSASVKKEMALFQAILEGSDEGADSDELLLWALTQSVARVVVKRPAKAPPLATRKPSHVIAGKAIRYDVYVLAALA